MSYDEALAARTRAVLAARTRAVLVARADLGERKMFGGLAFLVGGHMCCGILGNELMVRVGPEGFEEALSQPHARPMDFTGKPLRGMVYVAAAGLRTDRSLRAWVDRGLRFVTMLPPKSASTKAKRQPRRAH
jgi:TfoX/Sxy family transcriptional regulator of competence genes